jgi:hypothetical protein
MKRILGHREHLFRVAALFAAGAAAFGLVRSQLIPEDFGRLGHYRAGALDEARSRRPVHAGVAACVECHEEVRQEAAGFGHARIRCEACHGPHALHAQDPAQHAAVKPDATPLCLRCHQASVARPAAFPQMDRGEHAGEEPCLGCHAPHRPDMGGEEAKP